MGLQGTAGKDGEAGVAGPPGLTGPAGILRIQKKIFETDRLVSI